jgi:hypothetical protein
MVFCTYCGQSFTRDEHLERHILTREYLLLFNSHTSDFDPTMGSVGEHGLTWPHE